MERLKKFDLKELTAFFAFIVPSIKLLILPSILFYTSGRDSIFIPIIFAIIECSALFYILYLIKKHNNSFFQIISDVLGKIGAKIVFAIFALFFLFKLCLFLSESQLIAIEQLYEATPSKMFVIPIFILLAYGGYMGIRPLIRTSTLFIWAIGLSFLGLIALSIPAFKWNELLPLFEFGSKPIFEGIYISPIWFGDFLIPLFFAHQINFEKSKISSSIFWLAVGFLIFFTVIFLAIGIFGIISPRQIYLLSKISKYTVSFSSLGRIDFVFVISIFFDVLIYISLIFAIVVSIIKKITALNRALLSIVLSIALFAITSLISQDLNLFLQTIFQTLSPFIILIQYFLPFAILIAFQIKCKVSLEREQMHIIKEQIRRGT